MFILNLWVAGALAVEPPADTASPEAALEPAPPAPPRWPGHVDESSPHYDLEQMYTAQRHAEGLAESNRRIAAAPDKDLYWLKARFIYEMGESAEEDAGQDKEARYKEMLATTEAGLVLAPGDPHLRFARGIARGRLGTTRGVLASLFMAKDVEADWLSVAGSSWSYASINGSEVLPCDAHHALSIYYRLVPDLWLVQVVAGTRGSLDKSLSYAQHAVTCKPRRIEVHKELAVTQLCIGTKRKQPEMVAAGKATAERALTLPAVSAKHHLDRRHLKLLIADPKMACGYSRDGQQDLDEKKIAK